MRGEDRSEGEELPPAPNPSKTPKKHDLTPNFILLIRSVRTLPRPIRGRLWKARFPHPLNMAEYLEPPLGLGAKGRFENFFHAS